MSAKDERAREILRGFKLYPPGSGAGPGGLRRRPLPEETGRGGGVLWAPENRGSESRQEGNGVPGPCGTGHGRRAQELPAGGRGR